MKKVKVRRGSVEQQLSSLIIESKFKLLEQNLIEEGFFDDFKKDYAAEKQRMAKRKDLKRDQNQQKELERERMIYLRKGFPMPDHLKKHELRKFYYQRKLKPPEFLEGKEKEDSTRTKENEDSLVTKFSNLLGLHPDAENRVRRDVKKVGGGAAATGNFLNNLYKKITGVPFINSSGEVRQEEELSGGPDTSADSGSGQVDSVDNKKTGSSEEDSFIPGYGLKDGEVEGVPVETEMYYVFVPNVVKRANKFLGSSVSGDKENDVTMYVRNEIESNLLNPGKTDVVISKVPGKKKFKWGQIAKNIKNDKSNDKSDFDKYVCGHYFIGEDTAGKHGIYPIGTVSKDFIDTGALK